MIKIVQLNKLMGRKIIFNQVWEPNRCSLQSHLNSEIFYTIRNRITVPVNSLIERSLEITIESTIKKAIS